MSHKSWHFWFKLTLKRSDCDLSLLLSLWDESYFVLHKTFKKIKIPSWCPPTLQERKVHSKPSGGNKALWHSARILQNKVEPDSSRSHYGISSVVNQINGCLWCWRVALRWPLQMHSLICHIFLSTLQFDKQDLNWSLPHSQQSTVSCKWLREIFTALCVCHLMQSETAAATSLSFFFFRRRNVTEGEQHSACLFES